MVRVYGLGEQVVVTYTYLKEFSSRLLEERGGLNREEFRPPAEIQAPITTA